MMHRIHGIAWAAIAVAGLSTIAVAATQFQGEINVQDQGATLQVAGRLVGLGSRDVIVSLKATGTARITCTNPGDNSAPGQNREARSKVTVMGLVRIPAEQIKDGVVDFAVATDPVRLRSPAIAGCPNDRWEASVGDVEFNRVTVRVQQGGRVVLTHNVSI